MTDHPLLMTFTEPHDGAVLVPVDIVLEVYFNRAVRNAWILTVTGGDGHAEYGDAKTELHPMRQFVPKMQLRPYTTYTMSLSPINVMDEAGQQLSGSASWSFTTGADTMRPQVRAVYPAPAETVCSDSFGVAIMFTEPVMNLTSTTFEVRGAAGPLAGVYGTESDGYVAHFTPTTRAFADGETITVRASGVTDSIGQPMTTTLTHEFRVHSAACAPCDDCL